MTDREDLLCGLAVVAARLSAAVGTILMGEGDTETAVEASALAGEAQALVLALSGGRANALPVLNHAIIEARAEARWQQLRRAGWS